MIYDDFVFRHAVDVTST